MTRTQIFSASPAAQTIAKIHPMDKKLMSNPKRYARNEEPSLDEVLTDPMVRTLMSSDGVARDSLRSLIVQAKEHLSAA